jgi:hypothetical protein
MQEEINDRMQVIDDHTTGNEHKNNYMMFGFIIMLLIFCSLYTYFK